MQDWTRTMREAIVSGTAAGLLSAAVLAVAGKRDAGSPVAAFNAESHWLWGDESLREDHATLRHTVPGLLTHHLSTIFWAGLHALLRPRGSATSRIPQAVAGGLATGAAAAAIDYTLVPRRLTPGFEHRLSTPSMVAVFAAIAAGIAFGTLLVRESDR